MNLILAPGKLSLSQLRQLQDESTSLSLNPSAYQAIQAAEKVIHTVIENEQTVYGINTGFGALANTKISTQELANLQKSIVLSHAAGTGKLMDDSSVRLILALKINSLARGYSGVRLETIDTLIKLFNAHIYPCIPCQGSVGASGDLAPLAHLSAILLGIGQARHQGKIISAEQALALINTQPLILAPKEGLALLNGTQASTALAMQGLFAAENLLISGLITGALSVDAACGSDKPFDERIHLVRGHQSQIQTAAILRRLLKDSEIKSSHIGCQKIQDPYSLRCQPQVMGACLDQIKYACQTLLIECNAVSDNPLIFADNQDIISGGNFHAEPVAFAADNLALSLAEIGALSERRSALLVDTHFSGLPPFLVPQAGVNSGFMIAQVTAAALVSENKSLAHPASVDSLPTSANQEDHVSMATYAARRLLTMAENTSTILAIELLAACQGIDFRHPLKTSPLLSKIHHLLRQQVSFYDKDRFFAPDIEKAKILIQEKQVLQILKHELDMELL